MVAGEWNISCGDLSTCVGGGGRNNSKFVVTLVNIKFFILALLHTL